MPIIGKILIFREHERELTSQILMIIKSSISFIKLTVLKTS